LEVIQGFVRHVGEEKKGQDRPPIVGQDERPLHQDGERQTLETRFGLKVIANIT